MREIKFRIWEVLRKQMITDIVSFYCSIDDNGTLNTNNAIGKNIAMQYTGLKDKNDKDVYESDYLKDRQGRLWLIVWNEYKAGFQIQAQEKKKEFDGRIGPMSTSAQKYLLDEMELIGNLYENPELLTKE